MVPLNLINQFKIVTAPPPKKKESHHAHQQNISIDIATEHGTILSEITLNKLFLKPKYNDTLFYFTH